MIKHVVPITFLGGTGGNFLRALLISAKVDYKNLWDVSSHGNSHWGPLEMYNEIFNHVKSDLTCSVKEVLDCINTSTMKYDPEATFYQNFHIINLDEVMENFAKSIRVTFEFDDVVDVCTAMTAKNGVDSASLNINNFAEVKKFYIGRKMIMIKHLRDFQPTDKFGDRVLFISWKELLNQEGKQMFSRLSDFTGIPHYNFSIDNLERWRYLTRTTIDNLKKRYAYDFK